MWSFQLNAISKQKLSIYSLPLCQDTGLSGPPVTPPQGVRKALPKNRKTFLTPPVGEFLKPRVEPHNLRI